MLIVFDLSMCVARGNNCTVGNKNDLLGMFLGVVGWGNF